MTGTGDRHQMESVIGFARMRTLRRKCDAGPKKRAVTRPLDPFHRQMSHFKCDLKLCGLYLLSVNRQQNKSVIFHNREAELPLLRIEAEIRQLLET
jgi:hypothetical protein